MRDRRLPREIAYALLRVTMGIVFLFAGVNKFIDGLGEWVSGMQERFAETFLPEVLVTLYAYALPFAEVALGTLLVLGLFNLATLTLAGVLMLSLAFGTAVDPDPSGTHRNATYMVVIVLLLWLAEHNRYSLDRLLRRGGVGSE